MNKILPILKKILKVILWVAGIFVLLFIILAVLIQIPSIQTKIVHYATTFVSDKTHTRVEIRNVSISFPKSVVLEGVFLEDLHKDTMLYADKVKVNIVLKDLLANKITVNNVALEGVKLNLYSTPTDSLFNYNFLIAAFADTTKQVKPVSATAVKWTFSVDNVSLGHIKIRYNDAFGGIDVSGNLNKLELEIHNMDIEKSLYNIDDLWVDGLMAKVLMTTSHKTKDSTSTAILPTFTANKIVIKNSNVTYSDAVNRQSVNAVIKRFELKNGTVDLQNEMVKLDNVYLSNSRVQYSSRISKDTTISTPSTTKSDWKVSVQNVYFDENLLAYEVENTPIIKKAFDANHLNYCHIKLEASKLYYSAAKTEASVHKFSAIDQNNFAITRFQTDFSMDSHSITVNNLNASTNNSSVDGDLKISFSSLQALQDSIASMGLNVNMKTVSVQNSDILYFSPALIAQAFFQNLTNKTSISGNVKGRINNMTGKNVVVTTGINTILKTDFGIVGLPNAVTAFYDFPNLKVNSSKQDIKMMAGASIPTSIELPDTIALEAIFKGKMKAFETKMDVKSSFGAANVRANIDRQENFKGDMNFTHFDLGKLLKDKAMYGPVTLNAQVDGHGLDAKTITAQIKAEATEIYLNKYTYHNLKVNGTASGREFEGKVNLNDPNATFDFEGLVNLNPNQERYRFNLKVQGADLQKLNFTKDDIRVGLVAQSDLTGGSVTKLNGNAQITNLIIAQGKKRYVLDSVLLTSINVPNKSELKLKSALVDMNYSSRMSPTVLPAALTNFLNKYFPFTDAKAAKKSSPMPNFMFDVQLHNHPILSEVLFPQLKEFEPGLIQGSFDSLKNDLKLTANISKMLYGTTEINNLVVDVNSDSTVLNYKLSIAKISNSQINLDNFWFDGKIANNKITANVSSINDQGNKKLLVRSEITKEKTNYKLALDPKNFYLMNNRWDIAPDNYIAFGEKGFLIHHLFMNNGASQMNIASVHDKFNDDVNIAIHHFKLEDISRIVEKDTSLIMGDVDGNVLLKRVNSSYGIIADAQIANLFVKNVPIGNLVLKADNPTTQRFDIDMKLSGTDNNVTASGHYIPNGGDNSINIKADIQSLSMKTVEAFSMGQISEASGKMTGNFLIQGRTDAPEITGEMVFDNAFMNPAYLNNRLELKHEAIQLKTDGLYFKDFTLLDVNQRKAVIDGKVKMRQFSDYVFDLQVNARNFLLFNTTSKDNKDFFGRMIVDSKINVKGPMSLPVINGRVKMRKGSNFTFAVPENKLTSDKGESVVEFEDSVSLNSILYRTDKKEVPKSGFTGFDLTSVLEVDKEATLKLLMDPTSSDSLVVKGEAALSFTMDRSGKMSLTGAYNLSDGSYMVSLESIIKKKFDIIPGSTIIWNGDPLDADISINATYSVRAAPYDLVAGQMSGMSDTDKGGYKQTYPFLVMLKLRGEILHPEISFEIQLKPEDKGILGGAVNQKLNMLNEDESALNKQVFALLVLGRFVQENPLQTESGGTSSLLRSTVGNFLSLQLNKLSSKVVPGVELNFDVQSYDDYQTGTAQGRTQVEIGVKKQLFNERLSVSVGGTVDVEGDKAKQNSASDIAGDVSVEYKLTKDGRYRLKGFRQNLYEGAIEGQLVETGVGVVYVRDFDKWKELFMKPKERVKRQIIPKEPIENP
ncbi:MAG: translocation/assembly module TamB domain-containing protein [Paludibacter sp.]